MAVIAFLLLAAASFVAWHFVSQPKNMQKDLAKFAKAGVEVKNDFGAIPKVTLAKTKDGFQAKDNLAHEGVEVKYNDPGSEGKGSDPGAPDGQKEMQINFPKDYSRPLEVKFGKGRSILVTDENSQNFSQQALADFVSGTSPQDGTSAIGTLRSLMEKILPSAEAQENYLKYQSKDGRKSVYYAYQKDQAMGERQLKNWIIYEKGSGQEAESYTFQNARLALDDQGQVQVFFDDGQEQKNQQAIADVDPNLMERARQAILKDAEQDIAQKGNAKPDFIIPQAYYISADGNRKSVDWKIDGTSKLKLDFSPAKDDYPIALDPTLQFTAPGTSNSVSLLNGESSNNYFGDTLVAADFNADGKTDLAVGAYGYGSYRGRVYIFYQGSFSASAAAADAIITGENTNDYFGSSLVAADFNADGKTDLAVGTDYYQALDQTGRVYIFYQGNFPAAAASADKIITGEGTSNLFGNSLVAADFNADGKTDLAVGANGYGSVKGRVYIFYQGNFPASAALADAIITGENNSDQFGSSLAAGDLNVDGKTDLVASASGYPSNNYHGRVYIFYQGNFPAAAALADNIITGESDYGRFGASLALGDLDGDGKTDLAVGAPYSGATGRIYIFHNGNYPASSSSADSIVAGENTSSDYFASRLIVADLNNDGEADLVAGAWGNSRNKGRVYIFYNGHFPSTGSLADVIISGENDGNRFGTSLAIGDFNADGKTDLAVGAYGYNSNQGRAYTFYSQNGILNKDSSISGENTGDQFTSSLAAGDLNADGKTDLAVGAFGYNSNQGRVYIFYNGDYPVSAASADAIITGENTDDAFGTSLTAGDLNADGKTDLAVGANGYSSYKGCIYIFYQGNFPVSAVSADAIIAGENAGNFFGCSLAAGDLNADGKTDLVAGGIYASGNIGRVYVFYQANFPVSAANADIIVTGEAAGNWFGESLAIGDFNTDGKSDLVAGASNYSGNDTGRAYIFYSDASHFGTVSCTSGCLAANADAKISGQSSLTQFGKTMTAGDFNADNKIDLAVGAPRYNGYQGRVYIFYNGNYPATAASASVTISGDASTYTLGSSLAAGDLNADGRTDLVAGAPGYAGFSGHVYIFYNDGSIPTTVATTDVIITAENNTDFFGYSLAAADFNSDGKTDLVVGAYGYNSSQGKLYLYSSLNNYAWTLQRQPDGVRFSGAVGDELKTSGVPASNFGTSFTAGDFNQDGRMDLAVGAPGYDSSRGRVYIFWNDGSVPTSAYSPDAVITGENIGDLFGSALGAADISSTQDGKTDLAVGAPGYAGSTGRAYLFYQSNFPASAASANVIIFGGAAGDSFGSSLALGVLNYNVRTKADVVIGASNYNSGQGRAYIFYNDGAYPTTAGSADVTFTGETVGDNFGSSLAIGDVNANDGLTDLVIGASAYNSSQGGVYIFNNDGAYPAAGSADVIITGEAGSRFGVSLAIGDLDTSADGRADLAVGAPDYNSSQGRTYIFRNDGSIPTAAGSADTVITGENVGDQFGYSLTAADFNSDSKTDLAVGAYGYASNAFQGRVYVFYNDGSYPADGASADMSITGENAGDNYGSSLANLDINYDGRADLVVGANSFGSDQGRIYIYTFNDTISSGETGSGSGLGTSLVAGDLNADGMIDLAVGAPTYNSSQGRVYIFYNKNGAFDTSAAEADKIISGEGSYDNFSFTLAAGDLNADGKTDLAVGAISHISGSSQGRVYVFYNGNYPASAASADAKISGENNSDYFSASLATGDLNADGKTDLAVGAYGYASNAFQGRVYVFYNGNYPASAASADAKISGENNSDCFGSSLATGDLNADGKTDLAVSAYGLPLGSWKGRVYIFYNGNFPASAASADAKITGENNSDYFGISLATGDLNADGKTDLAVGAFGVDSGSFKGRVYIFYQGNYPASAAAADAVITGENNFDGLGISLAAADFNSDGKTDLAVGASYYPSNAYKGRVYIFYQGNYPASAAAADAKIDGKNDGDNFGYALAAGDFNIDGKTDFVAGAVGASSGDGRFYIIISEAAKATDVEIQQMQNKLKARGTVKFKGNVQVR